MNIQEVVDILKTEKECVERQGTLACPNRDCENCDLLLPTEDVLKAYTLAIDYIKGRANIKNRTGKWITVDHQRFLYRCSECGTEGNVNTCNYIPIWKFCPICGTEMREEDE